MVDEEEILEVFLLDSVKYCSSRRQVKWLELRLQDSSGSISARVWGEHVRMEYQNMAGRLVLVRGKVHFYAGRPELAVEQIQEISEEKVDLNEIILQIPQEEAEKLEASVVTLIDKIQDDLLRQFVSEVLTQERIRKMSTLPVHVNGHHNFRGGMLEHTFEVAYGAYYHAKAVSLIRTQAVSLDMIIAGALLHDIGVFTLVGFQGYSCYRKPFDMLFGRFAGYELMIPAREKSGISSEIFAHLLHIVEASHDGEVIPKTMEAIAVRSANLLSIETRGLEDSFQNVDQYRNGATSTWSRILNREIYRLKGEESACEL